jgi:hypothetical protein
MQPVSLMGFQHVDTHRISLTYPFVSVDPDLKVKKVFVTNQGSRMMIMDRENTSILPAMRMPLLELVSAAETETFIDGLEISPDVLNPYYRCYGDADIDIKGLCNSPYDVMGLPKRRPNTWDIPCQQDSDCPFFQANKRYPNTRGGCMNDGLCEFPVGVRRVSYRRYSDTPFCYGCKNPMDKTCCDKTADYAFKDDLADRQAAGLDTGIAKIAA